MRNRVRFPVPFALDCLAGGGGGGGGRVIEENSGSPPVITLGLE